MTANQLLAVMGTSDATRLRPHLEDVALEQGQILFQADEPITHIYFPHVGVISLQVLSADGAVVEAATVGHEGMVGLGGLLSGDVSFTRQLVQLPGRAARIGRDPFLSVVNKSATCADCWPDMPMLLPRRCCRPRPATPSTRRKNAWRAGC